MRFGVFVDPFLMPDPALFGPTTGIQDAATQPVRPDLRCERETALLQQVHRNRPRTRLVARNVTLSSIRSRNKAKKRENIPLSFVNFRHRVRIQLSQNSVQLFIIVRQ